MSSFKHLLRAKSARIVVPVFLSVFIALAAGISFSCSFLEDDGFFDKIEGEVSVANADKMNVYIRYASIKFGKTTPADAALYQVKNNVSFSVTAVTNSEYAFYRWAAFSTKDFDVAKQHLNLVYNNDDDYYSNFGGKELDVSVVKFENSHEATTNVTVLQTRDDIWIMPIVAVRPTITSTRPNANQTPVRNTKLRVRFSKPMDSQSFEGNFVITQAIDLANGDAGDEEDITDKFEMDINEKGNQITFSFKETSEMFNANAIVSIYFNDDISDNTGYKLANSQTLQWLIGKNIDNLPPIINEMTAGIGNDCQKFASTPTREAKKATSDLSNKLYTDELLTHRIKDKVNLYVYAGDIAKIDDKLEEGDVSGLGVRARSLIDLEGNAIESSKEGNFIADEIIPYLAAENNPNYSEISGDFKSITGKNVGTLYTYDLSSLPDGLIQIEVYAYDGNENNGDTGYDPSIDDEEGVGNGPRSIFVVKDNKAPAIENEVDKIKSSSIAAPYGWYNKLTIDTVEIYDTAANPILDFGHQKLGAAHENLKWVCNIGTSTDWQVPANDARWVSVSERYKIGSASIDNDGAVSVTIRLMDDLGNISEAKHITSVLCDNTVPDAGNMFCVDASGNQCLNSTKETVVPDSMLIRLPFTEELSGVKVVGLNIKASDGTKVENAFENASILYSAEGAPSAAEPVAIEPDTSSLKALLDSEGYAKSPIFTDGLDCLHVLGASYHTGIFYIKNLTLGDADGMYTVTITLYDAALNKAAEKSVMLAHDTKSPVVDRVVIQNVVPRKVYNENETTYWLPRSAYDDKKDAKYVSVSVTATENGSGVKVITIGENAHITGDTAFFIEGTPVAEGRCSIDPKTNTVVFSDYNNPDIYKQTGSVSFVLTNIRLDNPNSADGNKVSVSLKDFVDNSGINENAGNFDLYIDDTSGTKIYKVFSDSMAPGIDAKTPPALADGKADSASDETKYSAARLALEYTDTKNVDLSLTLSAQATGSGVRSLALTNGLFTADTNISVDGKPLAITEYTLDGPIVTFVNSVFTAENTLKFTNVELQGAEDGPQSISITATNFTGWVSKASATKAIVLDRAAPVVDDVRWNLKEGVYGVSKAAVVSNMDLCVTFTEVMTGVKVLGIDPKLNDVSATETPFDSTKFAIKYLSQTEAEAQTQASTEEAEESKEVKPIEKDPLALIGSAKLLKAEEDYTVSGNYITFKNPQNFKSGLFVLENLKVADNFEDNKSYKINVHLSDAALNGTAKDGQADLASDSTAPQIKRIFINRLIGRTQAGAQKFDSWWISKEDFEQTGKVPTKIDVELTINESGSGVETVVLGENLRLTAASEITCGTTKLVKESDYKVSSDFATITLITKSSPKFRDENNDFIVKISNATLTSEGENKVSVTLKDFALNSDVTPRDGTKYNSKLSEITNPESKTVESVFVDFTAPLLAEGGVKIVDRGGSPEIDGTADKDANTVALDGFTNEKLVNITVKTASSEDGSVKRSGVKQLVLSGAKYSSSSKFYYKDTASNNEDFAEIMNVDTGDGVTATFKNSYACENVCEFIITNVELTGAEGENTVSVYPVDLVGWSDSEKAVNDKITLDMTPPNWGNNAVVMGTIGENGNDADYVWPKTPGARILASDGEVYFYKRPQGSASEPIYLTVNASDTNFYGLYFVSEASDKSSGAVAIAAKESNKAILTKITDVEFDASSNHEYTIVLKDRAGNISTETKSVHVVKDGEAEIVNDDDESSSLQNNMEYKESRENYHIFKTSVPKTLTRKESEGVDGVSGVSGYAVYYNDGNGGKDGVNPVTIEVNLANHKEKNFTINSGVAYYAINGSAQAPAATLEGEYSAPTSALQNWNKWIPFTSGTTTITLYPKNDGKNPLNMRLWFKDNVGNVKSVEIKQKSEDGTLQAEPDIWICDNTIPQNANGTTDGFVPENSQLSSESTGFAFEKMMPDHAWFDGTTLKFMNTSSTALKTEEEGKTANTIYYTALSKLTLVINNEPSETVATESGEADSDNWAVKLFLYPSNSSTTPGREAVMSWIKEDANKNKYFYGIPSGSTITLSNIEYPKECSETTPYIYVVAEDRVGNINISKLNVKVNAVEYVSSGTAPAAKDYWYGKFVYSADEEAPQIWLGGTGVHGNKTYVDVNADDFSSAEDIAKLVPYNAGRRPYVDTATGKTWISSITYSSPTANSIAGYNTNHDYSTSDARRLFFYVDVDTEIPYAYYYSHSATPDSVSALSPSKIVDTSYSTNSSSWLILDTEASTYKIDGKVLIPTVIGNNDYMAKPSAPTAPTYLHVADKLGRVKSVRLGNTKYQHDNTSPTVNFTGLKMNDTKGLYRLEGSSTSLKITFSAEALKEITEKNNTVRVYIPDTYISDANSGLYGCSWEDHLLKSSDEDEDCKDENGYYLEFYTADKDKNGSLYIANTANKKFYIFDKVGNRKDVSINSSVDNKPPVLSMKFARYNTDAVTFDQGKIYDASTTNSTKLLDCSSETELSAGTFTGTSGNIGYSLENPYVVYSNAKSSVTSDGYIKGIFGAEDLDGNDEKQLITEVTVKTRIITSSGMSDEVDVSSLVNGFLHQDAVEKVSTLEMPIYLDGSGNTAADSTVKGDAFRGKLYTITIKDSGGNETTIYLKVMRDRTGPKFKYDATNYVDASHHAEVKGGVGYYGGKVFYQSSGANQAYIELAKADNYSDGSVSKGAAYDEDCGVVVKDILRRDYQTAGSSDQEPESGTAKYLLHGNTSSYPYYYYLYAEDKLGNASTVDLYVGSNKISSKLYYNDTKKPSISSVTMPSSTYGKFDATNKILYFNYNADNTKNNGYEKSSSSYGFQGFTIKFATSDDSSVTDVASAAKYCFIWNGSLTSLPSDFEEDLSVPESSKKYHAKAATASNNSFTIEPKTYCSTVNSEGTVYFYSVDYAKNLSSPVAIKIKQNNERPQISPVSDENLTNIVKNGGAYYFNKQSSIKVNISDSVAIEWYGLSNSVYNVNYENKYFANTLVHIPEDDRKIEIEPEISFAGFGASPSITGYYSVEGFGASSFSDSLFIAAWNIEGNASYIYWLPAGTKSTWIYDASVNSPSSLALPAHANGETPLAYLDSVNNKVSYSKAVDESTEKTFNVMIDFPADVAGITGYKIGYSSLTASSPSTSDISGIIEFTGTDKIAPSAPTDTTSTSRTIPISSQTDDRKVYIYAVDGLGNVSAPYSFTISKISYAPQVTGISIDEGDVTVAGPGAKFVVKDAGKIYVNAEATSITVKPQIDEDDITGTAGFALSNTGLNYSPKGADGSFTIALDALANGATGNYPIYAKNGIGLYSETRYLLQIIRDTTGPNVTSLTLTTPSGNSANLLTESSVKNLYYNSGKENVNITGKEDAKFGTGNSTAGIGVATEADAKLYAITTSSTAVPSTWYSSGELKLGEHNGSASSIYIAAKDLLGNIGYTALSAVSIKVDSGSAASINKFVFDNTTPPTPNGISLPSGTNGSGLFQKSSGDSTVADIDLYYNASLLGTNITEGKITVTPSSGTSTPAEANFKGFKLGADGEVDSTVKIPLTGGVVSVYAVDKAGNVSTTPYKINMIEDNDVAKPEFDSVHTAEDSDRIAWKNSTGKVIYKTGETSVELNIKFDKDDPTGIRGYTLGSDTGIQSTTLNDNGMAMLTVSIPTGTNKKISISAIDNVGNTSATLEIEFEELTNAPNLTGFDYTVSDGIIVKDKTIYVNGDVENVTLTPTLENEDVTGIKGFKVGTTGTLSASATSIELSVTETTKTYDIYAVNKLNLITAETGKLTVTIIRDTAGPVVSELTLSASGSTGRLNYIASEDKLYYNDSSASVSEVLAADNYGDVGIAETVGFAITADKGSETFTTTPAIGELSGTLTSNVVYIAAKDKLGNIGYTPLSNVKITIPAASTITVTGEPKQTVISGTETSPVTYTFVYDTVAPASPTGITGDDVLTKTIEGSTNAANLYYKSGLSLLTLIPSTSDTDLAGYFVSYNYNNDTTYTSVSASVSVDTSNSEARIIAVDKAGNVSHRYKLSLTSVPAPSITGFDKNDDGKYSVSGGEGKVYDGSDETNVIIYVNGDVSKITIKPVVSDDPTGIAGFALSNDSTSVTKNEDGSFTFQIGTDDNSDGGKDYTIYAKNNLGMWSEKKTVKVIRDTKGPVVAAITLTGPDGAAATETTPAVPAGKFNYDSGKLYYNSSSSYITVATDSISDRVGLKTGGYFAITTTNESAPEFTPDSQNLGTNVDEKSSDNVYIAAVDKLGNIEYTKLSDITITIVAASTLTGTDDIKLVDSDNKPVAFTFAYDGEIPGCPVNIDAPADKVGKGMWKSEPGTGIGTMYYNTDLLKEADSTIPDGTIYLKVTFPSDNTGIVGYKLQYNTTTDPISETNLFGTAIPAGATGNDSVRDIPVVITSNTLVRVFAVDMAGNVKIDDEDTPANYVVLLTKDDTAAKTIEQVTGDYANGSILMGKGPGGDVTYYKSDLELKLKLEPKESPIVSYLVAPKTDGNIPDLDWTDFESPISSTSDNVQISLGEITAAKTECSLWIKDAVGNIKSYLNNNNNKDRGNALGNPSSKNNLSSTYWHLYEKTDYILTSNEMDGNTLKLEGFQNYTPVKSLKFNGMILGADNMELDGTISVIQSDDTTRTINATSANISKDTDDSYTLTLKDANAYMVKNLEIKFKSGAFYFREGANVVVTTGFKTGDVADTVTIGLSKTLPTTYYYTYDSENKSLKFTGLLSKYNMNHFYIEGISFSDNNPEGKVDSVKVGETDATNYQFKKDGDKYDIQFNDNPGPSADSLTINFKVEPTLTDTLTISVQRWDLKNAVTLTAIKSDPAPSIFGGFFDRVSSGITSIFSGRSMTHEELEALKEAKAEKARARAAEKAAKKAAKKAARDAKRNAEIASASQNQGESWTGLSGEFESASSELDSALAKMKDSSVPEAKASDEVSSKKGIIKVKSGKKNAVSNSKELITDSTVRKSENHDNRMIYVFGFLAVLGVISGIFAKKVRKNSKKS
ncbi:MAG: hypothetical protein SPL22_08015 [Treponema sp.]|uniref:hypothetical protein n=1 Tax=Treponema sp. TaxID=166 RepID=UPI002A90B090|nr:hypothetical protein [Treponema sp.]MDY6397665.1 hypothetical protein [Treponema sp.]